jgi:hypothetical protein
MRIELFREFREELLQHIALKPPDKELQLQRSSKSIIEEIKLLLYTTSRFGFLSLLVDSCEALTVLAHYDTLTIGNTFVTIRPSIDSTDNSAREARMLRLMLPIPPNKTVTNRWSTLRNIRNFYQKYFKVNVVVAGLPSRGFVSLTTASIADKTLLLNNAKQVEEKNNALDRMTDLNEAFKRKLPLPKNFNEDDLKVNERRKRMGNYSWNSKKTERLRSIYENESRDDTASDDADTSSQPDMRPTNNALEDSGRNNNDGFIQQRARKRDVCISYYFNLLAENYIYFFAFYFIEIYTLFYFIDFSDSNVTFSYFIGSKYAHRQPFPTKTEDDRDRGRPRPARTAQSE